MLSNSVHYHLLLIMKWSTHMALCKKWYFAIRQYCNKCRHLTQVIPHLMKQTSLSTTVGGSWKRL